MHGVHKSFESELVINTCATGYVEIITDLSYYGQTIVFTQPHIGNYDLHNSEFESTNIHAKAIIVNQLSEQAIELMKWCKTKQIQNFQMLTQEF